MFPACSVSVGYVMLAVLLGSFFAVMRWCGLNLLCLNFFESDFEFLCTKCLRKVLFKGIVTLFHINSYLSALSSSCGLPDPSCWLPAALGSKVLWISVDLDYIFTGKVWVAPNLPLLLQWRRSNMECYLWVKECPPVLLLPHLLNSQSWSTTTEILVFCAKYQMCNLRSTPYNYWSSQRAPRNRVLWKSACFFSCGSIL